MSLFEELRPSLNEFSNQNFSAPLFFRNCWNYYKISCLNEVAEWVTEKTVEALSKSISADIAILVKTPSDFKTIVTLKVTETAVSAILKTRYWVNSWKYW